MIMTSLIAYHIGSVNFAIIFSKMIKKQDIRKYGSKNAGMTNIMRVYGKMAGVPVFLGDFLKGIVAVYLCNFLFGSVETFQNYGREIAGLSVILGHLYPIYFGFRGGKGIATSAGVILTQDLSFFIMVVAVFLIVWSIFKVTAIASMSAAVSYPISAIIFFKNYLIFIFSLIVMVLVIYAHRSNIKKLIKNW